MSSPYFGALYVFFRLNVIIKFNQVDFKVETGGRKYQGGKLVAWMMILHFSQTCACSIQQMGSSRWRSILWVLQKGTEVLVGGGGSEAIVQGLFLSSGNAGRVALNPWT